MRVIILAAGMGTRLGKYTKERPKGMLVFKGKSLLEWQIQTYHALGIRDIVVVTGYCANRIQFNGVQKCNNKNFETTNMVESLVCANEFLDSDVIVSYADLLLEVDVVKKLLDYQGDLGVVVDQDWEKYWKARYGKIDFDTESLKIKENKIVQLGDPDCSPSIIDARYVGLLKFSEQSIKKFVDIYNELKSSNIKGKWRNSKNIENAYMTDMIQEMIDRNQTVDCINIKNGWLEFDTVDDYEQYLDWSSSGETCDFYDFRKLNSLANYNN